MLINDYLLWNFRNIPEFVLDNFWYAKILDNSTDTFKSSSYFQEGLLDTAISEITFPQEKLSYKKTSFGLMNFENIDEYDTVTISYYDFINSPNGKKMPITKFFQDWMNVIFDKNNHVLHNDWRKHSKNIQATLFRPTNVGGVIVENKISTYEIRNCFPSSLNEISLSEEGSDRLKFTVELSCERVIFDYEKNSQ